MIELFQKFAELETASRLNARPSGLASALQNSEALLLNFGQSRCFPNVGKHRALSPPAPFGRGMAIECSCFLRLHTGNFAPISARGRYPIISYWQIGTHPLLPSPKQGGDIKELEAFVQRSEYRYMCLRHEWLSACGGMVISLRANGYLASREWLSACGGILPNYRIKASLSASLV